MDRQYRPPGDVMRRLAIVRRLHQEGMARSDQGEGFAFLAVLTFHDAAEMLLQLGVEHRGATLAKAADFSAYWVALAAVGVALPYREGMGRLNRARTGLKHHGLSPARAEVQGFRTLVDNFLQEACEALFGVDLASASQSDLIGDGPTRETLQAAEAALARLELKEALAGARRAFEANLGPASRKWLYDPGAATRTGHPRTGDRALDQALGGTIAGLAATFGEAVGVLGHRLDFQEYRLFRTTIGSIRVYGSGRVEHFGRTPLTETVVARCLAFCVEACLRAETERPSTPAPAPGAAS